MSETRAVTDFGQFNALRRDARAQDPKALEAAARQFEALFTQQLLKSARAAQLGDDLMGGTGTEFYQDLFDQQMATQLSAGKGLGIADLLIRQLQSSGALPAPAGASSPTPPYKAPPLSQEQFVASIRPHAEAAAKELGIPTQTLIAQAALETGWGRHVPTKADGSPSHNYFGIKADARWSGQRVEKLTQEVRGGVAQTESAQFRAYDSPAEGFADYVRFLRANPRYQDALNHGGDGERFVRGLQKAGYATDPSYAAKVARVQEREL